MPVTQNVVQRSRRRLNNLVHQPTGSGWFRVLRNDAGTPTRVDIYDEIGGGGGWFDDGGVTAVDFVAQLASISGDLEVHINSPGGDVFDGLAIYNALAQRPGNVTTIVDGLAASAASFIAMAGKQRLACPGAMMMIHDASGLCIGNASDMRELAGLLDKVSDNIAAIYAERSGQPAGWRDAMRTETWYTADEAVTAGLVHTLAQRPEQSALAAAALFDLSAYLHAPRIGAAAPAGATHAPFTGTHTHAHTAGGSQGEDATHEHKHSHDGDANHGHAHPSAHTETRPTAEAGSTPYEPATYSRDDDESVCCPACEKYNSPDARFCDQCGAKLVGRDDVTPEDAARLAPSAAASASVTAKALAIHHTATVDETWDGPAAVAAMPNDDTVLEYCHAWQSAKAAATPHKDGDDDADDQKGNYKFPHHKTKGGPANLAACHNGLARLAGSDIPDADRAGVKAHLQAHLDDAPGGDAHDHAGAPGWLHDHTAPAPAWMQPA